jgi:Ca-activated chloride channel family protein
MAAVTVPSQEAAALWARAHLRDLDDRLAGAEAHDAGPLRERIVAESLRFGVLSRLTAWVAVDERVVTEGGQPRRVVQPVELPSGWELPVVVPPPMFATAAARPRSGGFVAGGPMRPMAARAPEAVGGRAGRVGTGAAHVPATATREAQRLRAAEQAPEWERRELLADLGTRLGAVAMALGADARADTVRALAAELAEDRLAALAGDALRGLWDRTLALLDQLAGAGR